MPYIAEQCKPKRIHHSSRNSIHAFILRIRVEHGNVALANILLMLLKCGLQNSLKLKIKG